MDKQILLLCEKNMSYKGLERSMPIFNNNLSNKATNKLFNLVDDYGDIPYSKNNYETLMEIKRELLTKGVNTDLILISSKYDCKIEDKLKFLGYDITGESYYHSPIYRAFFESFSSFCSDVRMSEFKEKLNNNGLFENKNDSIEFLNYIVINYKNHFEDDQHIKPIQIFDCF